MIPADTPDLAIVVPTKNRKATLLQMLDRLATSTPGEGVELIVVDDGSTDSSAEAVGRLTFPKGWRVEVVRRSPSGPASARNAGASVAKSSVLLFLGDDSMPTQGLVEGHIRFHRDSPERERALLGLVEPCPPLDKQALQVWLHRSGAQFGYGNLRPGIVTPTCFWTSNVSLKRSLFEEAGGFDESFPHAACEDMELGLRLGRHGMELTYSDQVVAEHFHPTNLALTLIRMRRIGLSYRRLVELAPEMPAPPRPGSRHRLKALALEAMCAVSRSRVSADGTWRFLCDQVVREAYWDEAADDALPTIGSRLARRALQCPEANPPLAVEPQPVAVLGTAQ